MPSYEFHFEGLSNLGSSVEGLVQIQDVNFIFFPHMLVLATGALRVPAVVATSGSHWLK